jgi:hypothetical protein
MGKYVFNYYDGGDSGDLPMDKIIADWNTWFAELGDKVVDGGNPFGDGAQSVKKTGVSGVTGQPTTGYSIVSASSMQDAVEIAKGCPILRHSSAGEVQVYEALPM